MTGIAHTLLKSVPWYRKSCIAWMLKLSSTFVKGQINKWRVNTAIRRLSQISAILIIVHTWCMKTCNVLQTSHYFLTFFVCLKYFSVSLRFLTFRALLARVPEESHTEKIAATESSKDQAGKENSKSKTDIFVGTFNFANLSCCFTECTTEIY